MSAHRSSPPLSRWRGLYLTDWGGRLCILSQYIRGVELVTWLELDLQTFIKDLEIINMFGSDLAFIWALDMKKNAVITGSQT